MTNDMSFDERHDRRDAFLADFRRLVRKHAGADFAKADAVLLAMIQDATSVFNPYIWSGNDEA